MITGSMVGDGGRRGEARECRVAVCPQPEKNQRKSRRLKTILKLGMDSSRSPVLLEFIAFGRVLTGALGEARWFRRTQGTNRRH